MLSAGFATVTLLKSRLLPEAATDDTDHDKTLAALGKSVAASFDRHCNRSFARAVNAVDVFSARGSGWVLRRYPVEEIASVQLRSADNSLEDIDDSTWIVDELSGLLETESIAGHRMQRVVITYTGGYWLNPGNGTAKPAEATELEPDILEAWITQCQHAAESRGLFSAVSLRAQKDENEPRTTDLALLESVVAVLAPYRRFAGE